MIKRIIILSLFLLGVANSGVIAQNIRIPMELNFETWFDNREYKSKNAIDQTLFGAKLTPIVGLGWGDGNSINIGGDFRAEFGSKSFSKKPEFIMYYNYDSEKFKAYAGVFPRRKVMGDYPVLFFSDSVRHYDTNLDGALFQYVGQRGYVELACDWLSMISDDQREKFVLFSSGRIASKSRKFFAGYYLSMFHHSISHSEEGVVDNLLAYPYIGADFNKTEGKKYQGIMVKVGWVQAMQRDRKNEDKFVKPGGMQIELKLEKWKLGIHNTLYLGDGLMPYYGRYSNGLYQGDPLYRTEEDIFNRLEFFWNPVRRSDMNLKISWVQEYDGEKWGTQQLVTFSVNLNRNTIKRCANY